MASTFDIGPYDIVKPEDRQPVTLGDYWKQSWETGVRDTNFQAEAVNLREAFNATNEKIAKATGVSDLVNPVDYVPGYTARRQTAEEQRAPYEKWKARIQELQQAHPNALPWADVIEEPERTAYEKMKSIREATAAMEERLGLYQPVRRPGLGLLDQPIGMGEAMVKNLATSPVTWSTGFLAQFAAQSVSPEDAAVNFIPFFGGKAGRSIIKNAFSNAGQNMIGQAALSFGKMPQYERAKLPSGWDQWWAEVSGAAAAGFVLDAGARGVARSYKTAVGKTEGMGGLFTDAPRAIPLPEQPKARPPIPDDLIERARGDDLEALKEIARLTGVDEDPAVKGAIHYVETTGPVDEAIAQRFRELGVDDGEGLRVLADALRGADRYVRPPEPVVPAEPRMRDEGARLITEREPELQALITGLDQRLQQRIVDAVEAGIPRVVNIVQERLDAAKGKDAGEARASLIAGLDQAAEDLGGPERFAAMVDLYSGRGDIRTTAEAIRNFPDLVDADLAGSGLIQGARSIAKLEPEAFERFRSGDVSPGVARVVSDMVPPDQQARVIDDMRRAGIETETDARGVVGDLVKPSRGASDADAPLSRGSKIDDPAGAEAAKQTEILANELGEALKEAQAPIKARDKLETQMDAKLGEIAKIEEKAAKKAAKAEAAKDIPEHLFAMTADEVDAKPKPKGARQKIRLEGGPLSEAEGSVARGRLKHFAQSVIDQYETWREAGGDAEYRQMLLDQRREDNEQNLKDYSGVPFHYDIIGPDGKAVGSGVEGVVLGRTMVIDWIGGYGHENSLGIRVLKQLREQVRKDFPKVDTFAGYRVSGARAAAEAEDRRQVVKLFALSEEDIAAIGEKHAEYRDLQAQHREAMRGSPLFSLVMDRAAQQRSRDVGQAISVALRTADQILPSDVKVDVRTDEMRDPTTGNRLEATSNTRTGDIELAAYALNPAARLGHEAVHTLVTRGLLSPEEVSLLAKAAREAGAFTKEADYREAYKARADLDRLIEEEAAAHYLEAVIARRVEPTIPRNLVEKIHQIIERIRNALNGYGFRTETDVVRAIMEGDAAARRSVLAWMRSADMGAVAVDKAKGRMFALAGEKAQTANLDALARAKELEASGMDRDNIWTLTGWGRGADGRWRFEIDDSDAGFSARQSVRRESGQMGDRFEHPDLYEAYPALRALDLFWDRDMDPKKNLGGFTPDTGVVSLAANLPSQWSLPVLLHELQHGVQEMERFARGGSMGEFEVAPARVQGWLQGEDAQFIRGTYFERDITMSAAKVIDGFDGGDLEQLRYQVMKLVDRGEISLEAASRKIAQQMQTDGYTRLAGEVEARLVETRMDMTPEQRRERPFWYDYDVLQQEQDVRRRDMMFAMEDANTGQEMRRELDALGYYSQALEAAKALKQKKGTPEQMRSQLRSAGVKEAELAAVGLDAFLEGKKSVTKEEIVSFLRDNRVEVKEGTYQSGVDPGNYGQVPFHAEGASGGPKWASYSIDPSNPTYRETVIHLPKFEPEAEAQAAYEAARKRYEDALVKQDTIDRRKPTFTAEEQAIIDEVKSAGKVLQSMLVFIAAQNFTSGHWSEPNVIAHARTSLQKTADGKTMFLVDELQSDWGQKLRDGGARDEAKIADLGQRVESLQSEWTQIIEDFDSKPKYKGGVPKEDVPHTLRNMVQRNVGDEQAKRFVEIEKDLRLVYAELRTAEAATPGHPLVNTTDQWTTTAFRRLIRQAVEAGADYIALTPGKVQNERFNLAKQVDRLLYQPDTDMLAYQRAGSDQISHEPLRERGSTLEEFVGKEMAQKLREAPISADEKYGALGWREIPDLGSVEMGGSGMKATYDSIYPRTLGKMLAKMDKDAGVMSDRELHSSMDGRRFEGNWVDGGSWIKKTGPAIPFHTFPLTDKVKAEVGERGQMLFAMDERKAHAEAMGFDTSRVLYHGTGAKFDAFDPSRSLEGAIYLADDERIAKAYNWKNGKSPNVGAYYVRMENPLVIDAKGEPNHYPLLGRPFNEDGDIFKPKAQEAFPGIKQFGDYTEGWKATIVSTNGTEASLLVGLRQDQPEKRLGYKYVDILDLDGNVLWAKGLMHVDSDLPAARSAINTSIGRQDKPYNLITVFMADTIRKAKEGGHDGIVLANGTDNGQRAHNQYLVFDPRNIRSVNAEFDPAKADSPNLMYAMGEPRTPLQDDMEAISRLDAFKELVEACR